MTDFIYNIIILIVAAFSVIIGFRKGFTGQLSNVMGIAFGAVSCYIFSPVVALWINTNFGFIKHLPFPYFASGVFAAFIVYVAIYYFFTFFTSILSRTLRVFGIGIFNRIVGSFIGLLKNLIFVSLFYNLILCFHIDSNLLKYSSARDGNIVESVMMLSAVILGFENVHELSHEIQLREAKKISCNFNYKEYVIIKEAG